MPSIKTRAAGGARWAGSLTLRAGHSGVGPPRARGRAEQCGRSRKRPEVAGGGVSVRFGILWPSFFLVRSKRLCLSIPVAARTERARMLRQGVRPELGEGDDLCPSSPSVRDSESGTSRRCPLTLSSPRPTSGTHSSCAAEVSTSERQRPIWTTFSQSRALAPSKVAFASALLRVAHVAQAEVWTAAHARGPDGGRPRPPGKAAVWFCPRSRRGGSLGPSVCARGPFSVAERVAAEPLGSGPLHVGPGRRGPPHGSGVWASQPPAPSAKL